MEEILLTTTLSGEGVLVTIEAHRGRIDGFSDGKKVQFLREECRVLSGDFSVETVAGGARIAITLPLQQQP